MSRADLFANLRQSLSLSGVDLKRIPLQELFPIVDQVLLAADAVLRGMNSAIGFDENSISDPYCFSVLKNGIYAGTLSDQLCGVCRAYLPDAFRQKIICPFCGTTLGADVVLEEGRKEFMRGETTAKVLTGKPIDYRTVKPQKRKKVYSKLSPTARKLQTWAKKREFGGLMPMPPELLQSILIADLRTVASLCPGYNSHVLRDLKTDDLILWILANQPKEPVHPGPPPTGAFKLQIKGETSYRPVIKKEDYE